jgi:hypothetical protein
MRENSGWRQEEQQDNELAYHSWKNLTNSTTPNIAQNQPEQQQQQQQQQQHSQHSQLFLTREEHKAATIAAYFLQDYEEGRPPTLSPNFANISNRQLEIYRIKHSFPWKVFGLTLATMLLFVASDFSNRLLTLLLQMFSVSILAMDLYMKEQLFDEDYKHEKRSRMDRVLVVSVMAFLCLFSVQSWVAFLFLANPAVHPSTLAISVFKPIIFFYESRRARDAFEALCGIAKKLIRVILIELYLILAFAAVACRLYYNDESFQNLGQSWLSLFARKYQASFGYSYCRQVCRFQINL